MSDNPYQDDKGNKDASITNTHGVGTMTPAHRKSGETHRVEGGPFLIGDTMTGGYGKGPGYPARLHNRRRQG